MSNSGNCPPLVGPALGDAAVKNASAQFMERGGPAARARAEVSRGRSVDEAARIAAKQGKGHAAELMQSAEQTVDSALRWKPFQSRPNQIPNDRHVDVEVMNGETRVNDAQMGVGSTRYLERKARTSLASQLVIPKEARDVFQQRNPAAFQRTTDQLAHDGTAARVLHGDLADQEARVALGRVLRHETGFGAGDVVRVTTMAGIESFAWSFGQSALFEVVDALRSGRPISGKNIKTALRRGAGAAVRSSAQTFVSVQLFLQKAGPKYKADILHAATRRSLWVGAVVDVVISTAVDVTRWIRGEITGEDLLRRLGVNICTAGTAALAVAGTMYLCQALPPWVTICACILAAWGGAKFGNMIGEAIFYPPPGWSPPLLGQPVPSST